MSVHGEYNRALEALLTSLRLLGDPRAKAWIEGLESARPHAGLDLSNAASACLDALNALDRARGLSSRVPEVGPDRDPLREPFEHLRAHCRMVLGIRDSSP